MPNPSLESRISVAVPALLVAIEADLKRVQAWVPPGSLLWLYTHIARHVVRRSLEALDQPPAARLYVCAKLRPRFIAHLDAATDKALSIATRTIDDLFTGLARRAVGGELPGGTPGHRPPPVYLATAQADLKRIQESVPVDSLLWLQAKNAHYAIGCALRELDTVGHGLESPESHQGGNRV